MTKKRGNGEGSICPVKGRKLWRVIVSAGHDARGKRIRKTFTSHPRTGEPFRTKRAAIDALPACHTAAKRERDRTASGVVVLRAAAHSELESLVF